MLKYFLLTLIAVFCFSFEADALIKQSIDQALSYKNSFSRKSRTNEKKETSTSDQNATTPSLSGKTKKVDLKNDFSKTVSVSAKDSIEITVSEVDNKYWKISYDTDCMLMLSNTIKNGIRTFKFAPRSTSNCSVYLDKIDENNKVISNKMVSIRVTE